MATINIRNTTSASVIFVGQTIAAGATFSIPATQQLAWGNDSVTLAAIAAGNLVVSDGVNDITDVNSALRYLQTGALITQKDSDNAILARIKQAPSGYTFILKAVDFTTSTAGSLYNLSAAGVDMGDCTLKFWDASGAQITDMTKLATTCIATTVDFEPTHDYYLIGGAVKVTQQPTVDVRLHVVCAPDVPASAGGNVAFVCNVNLKFLQPGDSVVADGRAAKQLTYNATYHTSKMRFMLHHPVGDARAISVYIEYFRAPGS